MAYLYMDGEELIELPYWDRKTYASREEEEQGNVKYLCIYECINLSINLSRYTSKSIYKHIHFNGA